MLSTHFGSAVLQSVEVSTVDGFQGQEKEIIIFSCVRTGGHRGNIGFLSDARRLNVAMTRAKCSLFVFGRAENLTQDPLWRALITDAKARGVFVPFDAWDSSSNAATSKAKITNLLYPSK